MINTYIFFFTILTLWTLTSVIYAVHTNDDIKNIILNETNTVSIIGEIDEHVTPHILHSLITIANNKQDVYVFLNTNGGSVYHGSKIVSEILKHNVKCIAQNAYSMGFVIFQACKQRYITQHTTLMQHQMSYGLHGKHQQVLSHIKLTKKINEHFLKFQAKRLGLTSYYLEDLIANDLWLYGQEIIDFKCADELVNVFCTDALINNFYFLQKNIYSKCPLIHGPLHFPVQL